MKHQQDLSNFIFTVRASNGVVVNHLQILAANQTAAEKQLFQMYRNCTVLGVKQASQQSKQTTAISSFESVLDIIASD